MSEKTEALRLADALDYGVYDAQMARVMDKAAAELRRLSAVEAEMLRYLPVLERAEADSELWARLTDGLGIATLNGYRAAIRARGSKE